MSMIPTASFATKGLVQQSTNEIQTNTVGGVLRNVSIAEMAVERIATEKTSWFRSIMPRQIDRVKAEAEVAMAKTEFDALHKTLQIIRMASVQALEESVNSVLLKGQGHIRRETLSDLNDQMIGFINDLNDGADRFAADISRRMAAAESIADPFAREMRQVQCREQVILYKQFSDQQVAEFQKLAAARLSVSGGK